MGFGKKVRDMFEYELLESVRQNLEKIKLVYRNASEERKKFIKEWIEGITIDKDSGDGYIDIKFDGENLIPIDEDDDSEIELEDLKESEIWALADDLKNLLEELGEEE